MIKNECEIVKDLFVGYLEGTLSKPSKDFVENHINECDNCKKILEELKKEKQNEKVEENKEAKKQINYLKGYNKKINILKTITVTLIIIILLIWVLICAVSLINYNNYVYKNNILASVCIPDLETDNFKCFAEKTSYKGRESSNLYYKDGKFKIIKTDIDGKNCVEYGIKKENEEPFKLEFDKDNPNELRACGVMNTGLLNEACYFQFANYVIMGSTMNSDWGSLGKEACMNLDFREENYENKDCFVITKYKKDGGNFQMWIEKSSYLVIRVTEDDDYEVKYRWEIETVTDDDLRANNYEEIMEEKNKEMKDGLRRIILDD